MPEWSGRARWVGWKVERFEMPEIPLLLVLVGWLKCCFMSTETVGLLGTGSQDVHLDFHILLSSVGGGGGCGGGGGSNKNLFQRLIRDGELRTATSTFTHLLSSEVRVLVQCCFTSTKKKPSGLLGTESPGRPPRLSHSS